MEIKGGKCGTFDEKRRKQRVKYQIKNKQINYNTQWKTEKSQHPPQLPNGTQKKLPRNAASCSAIVQHKIMVLPVRLQPVRLTSKVKDGKRCAFHFLPFNFALIFRRF